MPHTLIFEFPFSVETLNAVAFFSLETFAISSESTGSIQPQS
jgi:hypothetical protein